MVPYDDPVRARIVDLYHFTPIWMSVSGGLVHINRLLCDMQFWHATTDRCSSSMYGVIVGNDEQLSLSIDTHPGQHDAETKLTSRSDESISISLCNHLARVRQLNADLALISCIRVELDETRCHIPVICEIVSGTMPCVLEM